MAAANLWTAFPTVLYSLIPSAATISLKVNPLILGARYNTNSLPKSQFKKMLVIPSVFKDRPPLDPPRRDVIATAHVFQQLLTRGRLGTVFKAAFHTFRHYGKQMLEALKNQSLPADLDPPGQIRLSTA